MAGSGAGVKGGFAAWKRRSVEGWKRDDAG